MTNRYDTEAVLNVLKQALRKKEVTYAALAERLDMSESGVKKTMIGEDVSLARLAQICAAAEIDLMAILEAAWKAPPPAFEFTSEQAAFFRANPAVYDFLIALLQCRLDTRELGRRYRLDDPSIVRYLGKLEDLGLVSVFPEGRITCVIPAPYRTRGIDGLDEGKERFLAVALSQPRDARKIVMAGLRITKDHLDALQLALRDVILEYGVMAHQDELTRPDAELVDVHLLSAIARCRHADFVTIPKFR
jgi:hypothetical protein